MAKKKKRGKLTVMFLLVTVIAGGLMFWGMVNTSQRQAERSARDGTAEKAAQRTAEAPVDVPEEDVEDEARVQEPVRVAQDDAHADGEEGNAEEDVEVDGAELAGWLGGLRAKAAERFAGTWEQWRAAGGVVGSVVPTERGGRYELELRLAQDGAGVAQLTLANHYTTIHKTEHEVLQGWWLGTRPVDRPVDRAEEEGEEEAAEGEVGAEDAGATPDVVTSGGAQAGAVQWVQVSDGPMGMGQDDQREVWVVDEKTKKLTLTVEEASGEVAGEYTVLDEVVAEDASGRLIERTFWVAGVGAPVRTVHVRQVRVVGLADAEGVPGAVYWRPSGDGAFVCEIVDGQGDVSLRVERKYVVEQGSYDVLVEQTVENLSGHAVHVALHSAGATDLPMGRVTYGGDKRRVRFGYMLNAGSANAMIKGEKFLMPRKTALSRAAEDKPLWDTEAAGREDYELVWAGLTNRYFAVVHHPVVDEQTPMGRRVFTGVSGVGAAAVPTWTVGAEKDEAEGGIVRLMLYGKPVEVGAGRSAALTTGMYAGPKTEDVINAQREPRAAAVGVDEVVLYTFGGPCAFCTFQSLTHLLHWFLGILHDFVVFDWALAILVLVLCVRGLLHPITKHAQTSMFRFGKQMQAVAPKQKKIQERLNRMYPDDPKMRNAELQKEMRRLWREEGINFSGALGCLPMFLQTPIWIALYAMLYFSFELRHQGAFFGVVQQVTDGAWGFLGDLAEPDMFLTLPFSFDVPMMGTIAALNVLPLLLMVVFYMHQKYMTPPTSATMSPEQVQTQKMMRVITVVMFPVIMYNAPSGLALYFCCNSTLGIIESRYIRKRAERLDELKKDMPEEARGGKKKRKKRDGFIDRVRSRVEDRMKAVEQMKAEQARQKKLAEKRAKKKRY